MSSPFFYEGALVTTSSECATAYSQKVSGMSKVYPDLDWVKRLADRAWAIARTTGQHRGEISMHYRRLKSEHPELF